MTKELYLPIVSDGYLFSTEVEIKSTFSRVVNQLVIQIDTPEGVDLLDTNLSIGRIDLSKNLWIINNVHPNEPIKSIIYFRINDVTVLPASIPITIVSPIAVRDENPNDNSFTLKVFGATCSDLLNTCFGSHIPYTRTDEVTIDAFSASISSTGVYPVTVQEEVTGTYVFTVPISSSINSIYVAGDPTTVDGSLSLHLKVEDLSGNDVMLKGEVIQLATGDQLDKSAYGYTFSHTFEEPGKVVTSIESIGSEVGGYGLLLTSVEKKN